MKDGKSDIVRIRGDGALAGQPVAADDRAPRTESESAAVGDSSLYGGDRPINLKFPLCFDDIFFGYIVFPIVVAVLVPIPFKLLFFSGPLDPTDVLMALLFCVICALGVVWIIYSWFVDYYRKRARSITIAPATKTFRVCNFVLTRGKHGLPAFYPELTFTLDDVRKVYFQRTATSPVLIVDSGVYIVIPEGYLFVCGKTPEFLRLKYFLLVEAEGKNEATRCRTLDGVLRYWDRF